VILELVGFILGLLAIEACARSAARQAGDSLPGIS